MWRSASGSCLSQAPSLCTRRALGRSWGTSLLASDLVGRFARRATTNISAQPSQDPDLALELSTSHRTPITVPQPEGAASRRV